MADLDGGVERAPFEGELRGSPAAFTQRADVEPLPIDPCLPAIVRDVRERGGVVLVAEPGAGKTTRVPRALLDAGLADGGEIVVVEPRRIAARMAARRVADELGEPVGRRVGYRVRFDSKVSRDTRVTFVTEGILARRLDSDPLLEGVSVVVFDELHERHLHTDLALARARRAREHRALRIVAMSATLEAEPVARFLDAPIINVEGRTFPIEVRFAEALDERPLERRVRAAVVRLFDEGLDGDVLVFLPGAGEIRRAMDELEGPARALSADVVPLHGDLPPDAQDRAIRPGPRRKIILSTNVAETSLTIEGVVAVVDSGLARVARCSPWTGLSSLDTLPISRASAAQRAGRAGRTRPGVCVRLYPRADHDARPLRDRPEIERVDLAEMVLSLRAAGEDPRAFPYLEPPPANALESAERLLERLGAVEARVRARSRVDGPGKEREGRPGDAPAQPEGAPARVDEPGKPLEGRSREARPEEARPRGDGSSERREGALTELGRAMLALPIHPRLARVALEAKRLGHARSGAMLAALIAEREVRLAARTRIGAGREARTDEVASSDLIARLDELEALGPKASPSTLRSAGLDARAVRTVFDAARQIERELSAIGAKRSDGRPSPADARSAGAGVGARSGATHAIALESEESFDEEASLLYATLAGFPDRVARRRRPGSEELVLAGGGSARLDPASAVKEAELLALVDADSRPGGVLVRRASAVTLEMLMTLAIDRIEDVREARFDAARERVIGVAELRYEGLALEASEIDPGDEEAARVLAEAAVQSGIGRFVDEEAWIALKRRLAFARGFQPDLPELDDAFLRALLVRLCAGKRSFAELRRADLLEWVRAELGSGALSALDRLAPEAVSLPGRRRVPVTYEDDRPPWIASRLADFFGMSEGPAIANGRVPLVLHLLAPNQRAVQVTTDLAGFWERHYPELRKALMRRYPRHPWPDDPRNASPPAPRGRRSS